VDEGGELHPLRLAIHTGALGRLEQMVRVRQVNVRVGDINEIGQAVKCLPHSHLRLEIAVLGARSTVGSYGLVHAHALVVAAHRRRHFGAVLPECLWLFGVWLGRLQLLEHKPCGIGHTLAHLF